MKKQGVKFLYRLKSWLADDLISSIGLTFSRQILNLLFGLGFSIVIARTLGPDGNGQYALVILLSSTLSQFLNLGIPIANIYFTGRGDFEIKDVVKNNIYLCIFLSLTGMIIGTFIVFSFDISFFRESKETILTLALLLYSITLTNTFFTSIFQGLEDFASFNKAFILNSLTTFIGSIVFLYFLSLGVEGAIISAIVGNLFCLFFTISQLAKKTRLNLFYYLLNPSRISLTQIRFDWIKFRITLSYGWKANFSNIIAFFNYKADIFLLGYFLGAIPVGIYAVAVQLVEKLWFLSQAVSTVIFPKLSQIYNEKNSSSKTNLTLRMCRLVFLLTSIGAISLGIASVWIIPNLYGESFREAIGVIWLLIPGIILTSFSRVIANDLAARGHPEINLYSSLIALVANIILNLFLIPKWGLYGAASATTLAYTLNSAFKIMVYRKYTDIQ